MQEIPFLRILQNLELSSEFETKIIQKLYSQFNFFKISLIDENILFSHLKDFKFITFSHSSTPLHPTASKKEDHYNIFCAEKQFIFVKHTSENSLLEIIKNLKKKPIAVLDVSEKSSSQTEKEKIACQEIKNFISKLKKINEFTKITIRPILGYLIRRYYYPTSYFDDQSFFIFSSNPKFSIEKKLKKELMMNLFFVSMTETASKIVSNTNDAINNKKDFKESDFFVLRTIHSNEQAINNLVIHLDSLYIFVIKKLNDPDSNDKGKKHEIDFCSNYAHRCITPFYGFVKDNEKIIGFV